MNEMSKLRFYCDEGRCIECDGCSVACAEAHELPSGINRRKVITINEGKEGLEYSLSIACMHCTDAPCEQVCPVDCFYIREDGVVLHDKEKCIGCAYCLYACPFGAPQFPRDGAFGIKGAMDKCTMCAGGPLETNSSDERHIYGQNRISEGKVPVCASMCSTKALLVGDAQEVTKIYRERVLSRGHGVQTSPMTWSRAYGAK